MRQRDISQASEDYMLFDESNPTEADQSVNAINSFSDSKKLRQITDNSVCSTVKFKDQSCTIDASADNFFYDQSRMDDSILCKTEMSCFEEPLT